ncbi:MAG: CRTAC1 family protein [Planctomycetes bacterium]|nr:CRTAC1 family protein [Planctomycetota bacterium]
MNAARLIKYHVPVAGALCLVGLTFGSIAEATFTDQAATILGGVNYESRSASLADIDNDGDLDLFFQGTTQTSGPVARQLFRNDFIDTGTLTFTNITSTLPSTTLGSSWSAAWGDYNGDGRVDVFVGQTNSGTSGDVLRNDGASGFFNASTITGLNDPGFHQNVAWNDIDNDRDLDLIIGMEGPEKHEIYLQGSAGSFTPVGAAVGFQATLGTRGYGMAIGDTDGDGDLDIYISTCQPGGNVRNNFYENRLIQTGSLSFVDIADSNGTQYLSNSYGAEFHDFDNDGDLDLFMVGADQNPSKIWRNNGGNLFTDVDTLTGHPLLSDTAGDLNGARAVDYDNDGDLDLFFHDRMPLNGKNEARKLYRNDGNWAFTDVTASEGLAATNEGAYDSTWGDLDRDGDQDLIAPTAATISGNPVPERVFINNASTNGNHWLYVDLAGTTDNTSAIGATIYATLDTGAPQLLTLRREANTNAGTFNQSDVPVHFGLGAATTIDQLRIHWPDGAVQYLFDVAADQYLTVAYDSSLPGDLNRDGTVDTADYAIWRKGLNDSYTQLDFNLWRAHFGETSGGGLGGNESVPEPASALLPLILAAAGWLRRSFRRPRS